MTDLELENWEPIEALLRRHMRRMGHVLLHEHIKGDAYVALGRWDRDLEQAVQRGDVEPGDVEAGEDLDGAFAQSCIAWIHQTVAHNLPGVGPMKVRVRLYEPKGDRQLASARFVARREGGDEAEAIAQERADAPPLPPLSELDESSAGPGLRAAGSAHANIIRATAHTLGTVLPSVQDAFERTLAMERAGSARLISAYERRIDSLEQQNAGLQEANELLVAQIVDLKRQELEREGERQVEAIAQGDSARVLEKGLDKIEGMVGTAMALHAGLAPEVVRLLQRPELAGLLRDPRAQRALQRPEVVDQLREVLSDLGEEPEDDLIDDEPDDDFDDDQE